MLKIEDITEAPGWGRAELPLQLVKHDWLIGAEIGVQKGEYAMELLVAGVTSLHLVDLWARQENYFDIANVADVEHQKNLDMVKLLVQQFPAADIQIVRGNSARSAHLLGDNALDFVYIDADHKYASVRADLEAWFPKVRSGGLISGHDFMDSPNCCGSEFGVATAVKEFCAKIGVPVVNVAVGECFPNWHFVKP